MMVLLVDDDAAMLRVLTRVLRQKDIASTCCTSARQALAHLASTSHDALVTDHMMPGMTGLELVREVRVRFPDVRCVILSGFPPPESESDVVWLRKPLDVDALFLALRAG